MTDDRRGGQNRPRGQSTDRQNTDRQSGPKGSRQGGIQATRRGSRQQDEALREQKNRQGREQNAKKRAARRKRGNILTCILLILILVTVMVCLSLTVLFRISEVRAEGESRYSSEQIIEASGISEGVNMFSVKTEDVEKRICSQLPFVGSATVKRVLPSSVVISVTPETVAFTVKCDGGYAAASKDFKVLEVTDAAAEQTVVGLEAGEVKAGEALGISDPEKQALKSLKEAMDSVEMDEVTVIDMTEQNNIKLLYKSKYVLDLGSDELLEYKLKFCKKVAETEQNQGVVDVRFVTETNKKGFYSPKNISGEITLP